MSSSAATPWPLQVATLSTFLLLLVLCHQPLALASPSPFPKDLAPLNVVGPEQSYLYPGFQGLTSDNDTVRLGLDFQRMLRINHMLYIAARDHVFAVNLTTTTEQIVPQQQLTWRSKDVKMCAVRGRNSDECYNYIKVLVPRNDETLFACGTNAFNPGCRNYKMDTLEQVGEELVGQARCPFESHQSNVGIFAGGNFYSATMTDFLASDAVIYRSLGGEGSPVLRTVKYDSKWLREPRFLHAIEYGNYVYFFFSEIAVEYTSLGKVVFSRVARVCKNDGGGSPRVLDRYWTSFLKARLNCSLPGDSFFYFDVMQSLSNVLQINQRPAVIGVFTTQMNSIPGSAVCAFYMDDIERTFNGKFKEQKTSESAWTPVAEEQVPKPRPGSCAGDGPAAAYTSSTSFPDDMLTFIKSYPLMDEAVPSVGERPLFVRSASRYKLTQMAVDTSAGPYKNRTVLFLASEDGHVLKVLASTDPNATSGSTLLEDIDVYNPSKCDVQGDDRRVLGLELDKEHHALFVAFSTCVIRVPLSRCRNYGTCKRSCLASQDPYCVWLKTGSCASVTPGFKAGFEQDIEGDHSKYPDTCHNVLATTRNQNSAADSAYGVKGAPEMDKASHSVHYTLLIACVLVAFVLGAFLSAFVVSCYCSHSAHRHGQQLDKEPETPLPHALSLRSLAKLNGLLDTQPGKMDSKMDISSPKVYNSYIPNGKEHCTPVSHGTPGAESRDLSLHQGEDLSGLPTPDTTPELPIKSMKAFRNQWERNQNCNNAKEPNVASLGGGSGGGSSSMSSRPCSGLTQQVYPFSHSLPNGQGPGLSLHLPEERKISNDERAAMAGATAAPSPAQPYSLGPQSVVDVSTLDELLKHIHEANASGAGGGIAVLTSALLPGASSPGFSLHHAQIPETETASYYSSSTLPRDGLTRRLDMPPESLSSGAHPSHPQLQQQQHSHHHQQQQQQQQLQQLQPVPERSVSRQPSQRQSLIRMGSSAGAGGAIPRQRSSMSQWPAAQQRLVRVSSGSGGGYEIGEASRPLIPGAGGGGGGTCLTRQHSYSEPPHMHRAAMVRRTASLKPQLPPKPLLLPASSPLGQQGKFNY
ncbi:semaphorin-6D-like isoform X1 [Alosa sapidissima]|uniref:semaphorin-6D-like isoform X1 n=2 Tax=Alosa sapidissima TaxID=34773 RepID=UPI001C09D9C1|nr:semaphorin-6D-like isoform X1 [Alosa sapidissima]XP_041932105.1 semaphorin-6D-like isoform X1 [Alosa sapidissima]